MMSDFGFVTLRGTAFSFFPTMKETIKTGDPGMANKGGLKALQRVPERHSRC